MLDNLNKPYPFIDDLWFNLKAIVGISLGIFLFILFFQPVYLSGFEFNTQLLIIAGYGGIALIVLSLNNIIIPSIFPRLFLKGNWKLYMDILLQLISWAMLAVAYNFYTRYVGKVPLDFATSFRIVLVGFFPVIILIVINRFRMLHQKIQTLEKIGRKAGVIPMEPKEDPIIQFDSENRTEELSLRLSQILFIRSANNYIEVYWIDTGEPHRQLLRSTLLRAEKLLQKHKNILRCHRSTLVNADHIHGFTGTPGNLQLKLQYTEEKLPVSRQYIQSVKEAIQGRRGQ